MSQGLTIPRFSKQIYVIGLLKNSLFCDENLL